MGDKKLPHLLLTEAAEETPLMMSSSAGDTTAANAGHPKQTIIYYPPSDDTMSDRTEFNGSSITPGTSLHDNLGQLAEPPTSWKQILVKICCILMLLFFFVCSLGFLSDSFRLIAGKAAGEALQKETLISNPIVGVMMGILVTVAVQSSSTSTSIVVSLVSSGLFSVKTAIPIVMGANLGTSITNTIVALTHMTNRDDFERAFGGAVLHDMFNLLTVSTLLIVEKLTSYLEVTTTKIMSAFDLESKKGGEIQILSLLTKPFTSMVIQINKDVIIGWSINDPKYDDARLLKVWCNSTTTTDTSTITSADLPGTENGDEDLIGSDNKTSVKTAKKSGYTPNSKYIVMFSLAGKYLFNMFDFGDLTVGLILLGISLVLLCGCLVCIVKVLSSLLKGIAITKLVKLVATSIPLISS
ncbi:Sodium-dependent phosphate transport protein 2A [Orchesella cincta]|uniref:Sodium-dependent phosphate transport protein 2A n=1 Tax=Orchesella cincta TaxID=48709 RepID=A0A1D2MY27_ORCCI|nr:Sodium-dependent phosphate transport protein 2A [Orchesella cincta]